MITNLLHAPAACQEVKQPGKEPTPSQVEFLNKVRRNGGISGVAHNVEEAMEIIIN